MTREQRAPNDWLTIAVLALLLIAVGVALYLYWRSQHQPGQPAGPYTGPAQRGLVYAGEPRPTSPDIRVKVLTNTGYVVGYSEDRKDPLWAAFHLFPVKNPPIYPRPQRFSPDPRTDARVTESDYTGSHYDRGHMAPNHAIATRYGQQAQLETFLMSNICPQRHVLNAEVWERLEKIESDDYAQKYDVWVFAGPIFDASPPTIKHGIQVPASFYRILIREQSGRPQTLSVIMPQEGLKGTEQPSQFFVSIRQIEDQSHLEFLWQLDPALQQQLKREAPTRMW